MLHSYLISPVPLFLGVCQDETIDFITVSPYVLRLSPNIIKPVETVAWFIHERYVRRSHRASYIVLGLFLALLLYTPKRCPFSRRIRLGGSYHPLRQVW